MLKTPYSSALSNGGISPKHCTATVDGTRIAVKFVCDGWEPVKFEPQAGMAVYELTNTLLRFLGIERATLMGLSAGGMVAIDFTLAHPDMVDALVLVGTAMSGFAPSKHAQQRGEAAIRPLIEDDDVEQTIDNWVNDLHVIAPMNTTARQRLRKSLTPIPMIHMTHTGTLLRNQANQRLEEFPRFTFLHC